MCAHGQIAIYSVPHSICPVNQGSQEAHYHQRIEMFQIIAGNRNEMFAAKALSRISGHPGIGQSVSCFDCVSEHRQAAVPRVILVV